MIAENIVKQRKLETKPVILSAVNKTSKPKDYIWSSIRKQKIATSQPLTLSDLIDIALRNNPATAQVWQNTRVAEAEDKQAESKLYPEAKLSADLTGERSFANQATADYNDLHYGPELKLTYLLLDFGGRGASIEETSRKLAAANFQFNQALQDLLLNVETAYYELHSSYSSLEAAELDVENAKTDFEAAQQKFEVGLVSKLDVLQAKSNYDDALYSLEKTKGQVKDARAGLAQVIGFPADTKFEIAPPSREIPTEITEEDVTKLIEEAIERRPDLASSRGLLDAKRAAIKAANSDLWPTLSLGGTTATNKYKYYSNARDKTHDYKYSGYLSLEWDLFDGFYNLNRKRAAQAEAYAERDKLIQAEIAASAQVWTKYFNFSTATRKLKFSEAFFESSGSSYELALEGYKTGLKSILDLIQAQSKLSEARSKLIGSKKDVFIALAELAHASGSLYAK